MQTCPHCKESKILEDFCPSSRGKAGSWCRVCLNESRKAWAKRNPDKVRAHKREAAKRNPERTQELRRLRYERRKEAEQARMRAYYQEQRTYWRAQARFKKFGLTASEFDAMVERQGGVCCLCGSPPGARALAVDHDHETGKIRDLLCSTCNVGLGAFFDDPDLLESAAAYIRKHQESDSEANVVVGLGS